MKKVFIGIVLYCIATISYAQPRVDGDKPLKITKVSQIITNPVGWKYDNITKKWCGYYGLIYDDFKNNNKKPIWPNISSISDYFFFCSNNQSVLSIQIKQTKIDTTTCYLLYVQRYWIDWDYPTLRRGRHNYKEFAIYVLPIEEYDKLWSLDTNVTKICLGGNVSYSPNYNDLRGYKNERIALVNLNNINNLTKQKYGEYYLYIKKENENTIRFYPPTTHSMVGERQHAGGWDDQIDLSKEYFEVSVATFSKLKIQ